METKEGQYIVPEDIARDLKNELDVDYSPSGMRNALHRINYTCKTMEPRHSNMQSVEDVLEWQHDMKRWFSRLKKDKIDVWCNDTTTLRHDIARRFGLWAPEGQRVFGTYYGNHISRFINGAVSLSGKRFFTATNTLATPVVIDFFTDLLKWRGKIAAILDRASWNKSGKMKQFLADNEERIDYRYFPVGWPQLNPTEGFWNTLKRIHLCMNIMIMWMKEWVELYTFCKTRASTLTVKRIFSGIQNPLQIFSSVAIAARTQAGVSTWVLVTDGLQVFCAAATKAFLVQEGL